MQCILNQLFVVFDSRLQIAHSESLVLAMSNENRARTVQISCKVALEIGHIRAIVDCQLLKTCKWLVFTPICSSENVYLPSTSQLQFTVP